MRAIIVGGGKVGYYLLKTLKERGHEATLIEKDIRICRKIAEELGVDVVCGDGTDLDLLRESGISETEVIAAVTGKDEENLVVCKMAKIDFGVNKTIARINNPKNRHIFKALGVDKTVCSTEVIANLIEWELESTRLKVVQTFSMGEVLLAEAEIDEGSKWAGARIEELELPQECVVVSVTRDEKVLFPRGSTVINAGDKIMILTKLDKMKLMQKSIFKD